MSLYEIEEHIGAMIEEAELPTEADLKEQQPEIDKWIKANSQKSIPPRADSVSKPKEIQPKIVQPKSAKKQEAQRSQPGMINKNIKPVQTPAVHPAEQVKPVRETAQASPLRPSEAKVSTDQQMPESTPVQSAEAKPFIKRLLQRITGR